MKHIASCSFGKDSCAMVLKIIELGLPIDEVVFYDTGAGFIGKYGQEYQTMHQQREMAK